MPDVVKQHKITFAKSLPMGTRGTFMHDGELWIAFPAWKNQRINAMLDRLIGLHRLTTKRMVSWINRRPQDAELVAEVLEITSGAQALYEELIHEKSEAVTA